jgi:uracil phosphoribosyltransferase
MTNQKNKDKDYKEILDYLRNNHEYKNFVELLKQIKKELLKEIIKDMEYLFDCVKYKKDPRSGLLVVDTWTLRVLILDKIDKYKQKLSK